MKIESILAKHARPPSLHSAEPVKQGLLEDLRAQKLFDSRLYGALFAVVSVITLVGVATLLIDLMNGQTVRSKILAGAGVGIPFMLEWVRRVVREWSQLNLLITLVGHSDESAIQALIQKLLSSGSLGLQSGLPLTKSPTTTE